jgi:hypothetical protein
MPNNRRGFGRMASDTLVSSTEKLVNPSFESSSTQLTGWDVAAGINATINTNSTYVQSGSRSAHITWTNIDDTLGQNITTLTSGATYLTSGATYLFSGYVYVVSGVAVVLMYDLNIGVNGEAVCVEAFCKTGQWEEFNIIFQATNSTLIFQLTTMYDATDVYLDNLSLKRMN